MFKYIIILLLPMVVFSATISGFLRDANDNEALIEGNLTLYGTNYGASSNNDGYFVISGVPKGNYKLVAQYVGYKKVEKKISIYGKTQNLKLNIKLNEVGIALKEVVFTAEADNGKAFEIAKDIRVSEMKVNLRGIKTSPTFILPDVFRTIKTFPGVTSTSDYSTGLFVRGGRDDHNLILYDGITVYNPSHMFGLFSTFMPDALRDTKLIKSAYGAKYGGRLGAVLDVNVLSLLIM